MRDYADDIYSATTAIEVKDFDKTDDLLRSLWDNMNAALVAGDKDGYCVELFEYWCES